ncbi:MAG: pseudouridine synthase [Chitinophagaceae bacterium]|jgi:23S rRNA pseudouridine2457 synthase
MHDTNRYFLLNKPYNMVSQFKSDHPVRLLGDLSFNFPEGTHALGRLDNESEGLLLLTTDKRATKLLFEKNKNHKRVYKVMVFKTVSNEVVQKLQNGVEFKARGGVDYTTKPCEVKVIEDPNFTFTSTYQKSEFRAYSWLEFVLTEGKYRQVRKMCETVGHRCKRLVRTSIEGLTLDGIGVGEIKEVNAEYFYENLNIKV